MTIYNITGDDTFTVFDRVLNDFADDAVSTITFSTDIVNVKTGKNKNTIFAKNEAGSNASVQMRIMRGSSDDIFLQGKFAAMERDFAAHSLANGEFVKRLGDGQGNIVRDVYTLLGGTFQRKIDSQENTSGETEQGVAVYNLIFANAIRTEQ